MLASRLHWRLLVGTIVLLMAALLIAPRWFPAPQLVENRVLAPAPARPQALAEFGAFRKAADAYVADNFPGRPHMIGALNRLRMMVGVSGSERVIVGRDGWLYFDDGSHLGAVRNAPPMSPPAIGDWLSFLAGATEAYKAHGAGFVVVVPPMKEVIYPQHAPSWYAGPSPYRPARMLPALAKAAGAGEVLYLQDAVQAATRRGEKTYSRHDTHWTSYGAYAGYAALMTRLQAMGLVDEGPLPVSAFTKDFGDPAAGPRDLALMLGVSSFVDVDFPTFANPAFMAPVKLTYLTDKHDWTAPLVLDTGAVGKPVLMMRRDSFSTALAPFLYPHFSRLVLTHTQERDWPQDLIDRYRPDLVILQVIEAGLPVAASAAPPPSVEAAARIEAVVRNLPAAASAHAARLAEPRPRELKTMQRARVTDRCNIEVASLARALGGQSVLTVGGWIFDFENAARSPRGLLRLQGPGVDLLTPIKTDDPRPDVGAHFNRPDAANSGFTGEFLALRSPPGEYSLTVYSQTTKDWIACPGRERLTLK